MAAPPQYDVTGSSTVENQIIGLAAALGSSVSAAMPVPWGDSGSTVRLILEDGRILAARHLDTVDATALATRLVARSEGFERSGVLVPTPMTVVSSPDAGVWVTTPWLDGATGASMLDDPSRCFELAAGMADLSSLVGNVDPTDLDLDGDWAEPGRLGVVTPSAGLVSSIPFYITPRGGA